MTLFFLVSSLLFSCSVQPQPIAYGYDYCDYCRMTIVDQQHAAELVTVKGKAHKYDAIECMMRDLKKWEPHEVALYLITDYARPGELTDAATATYLISENLPSPMGANLTGFLNAGVAGQVQKEKTGQVLNWAELQEKFK
jgi:copper chaperone NosL